MALSFLLGVVRRGRRVAWWAGTITAGCLLVEMVIIVGAAAVGATSHFNETTPFHATLWHVMAGSIMVVAGIALLVAVLLFRADLGDPARPLAIRAGVLIAVAGMGLAFLMTEPTATQLDNFTGIAALATMVPAEKKGVVVLINGGSGLGFGETAQLRNGITARALGLDYNGEGFRLPQKALFISLVLQPIVYLLAMGSAWRHRVAIRAKSGIFGRFSLWFPLLTTLAAAWVILGLVPRLFGSPLANIRMFAPDFGLALIATAVTGVLWAIFRLGVAHTGRSGPA